MKKNIIILLVLAMMSVYIPAVTVSAAGASNLEALSMDMVPTSRSINSIVDHNTKLAAAQAHGRTTVDRKIAAFSNINYSAIEDGKDWVSFGMVLKNDTVKDFSDVKDSAKISYTMKVEENVDINNLYFLTYSSNGAISGVSALPYLSADSDENDKADVYERIVSINIPLSAFSETSAKAFIDGKAFDAAAFNGIGIARCKGAEDDVSSGKIYFTSMSVIALPAITDLSAQALSGVTLSFTKPETETIDKYEIVKSDGSDSTVITCTEDDFAYSEGKYSYVDSNVEADTDYTYKIRAHETTYDIYSKYSSTVSVYISEDNGGTDIPSGNSDTIVWDMISRDFEWTSDRQLYSTVYYRGGANESYQKATSNGWHRS